MTTAGYLTTVKVTGTSTAFTGAATTSLGSNRYQITDTTKRILDPAAGITVRDGVTVLAATAYSVNYLFGIVTLNAAPAGAVTVDGSYLPTLAVAEARSCSVNPTRAELDSGIFGEDYSKFELGKKTADGSLEQLQLFDVDFGGGVTWQTLQNGSTPKLLEVGLGGSRFFRAWVLLPGLSAEAPADGLVTGTVNFKSVVQYAAGRSERVSFGFGA